MTIIKSSSDYQTTRFTRGNGTVILTYLSLQNDNMAGEDVYWVTKDVHGELFFYTHENGTYAKVPTYSLPVDTEIRVFISRSVSSNQYIPLRLSYRL